MDAADYLYLLFAQHRLVANLSTAALPALTGLTAGEVAAVVNGRAPTLQDLERCRAVAFALDAGLTLRQALAILPAEWSYVSAIKEVAEAALGGPTLQHMDPGVRSCVIAIAFRISEVDLSSKEAA